METLLIILGSLCGAALITGISIIGLIKFLNIPAIKKVL